MNIALKPECEDQQQIADLVFTLVRVSEREVETVVTSYQPGTASITHVYSSGTTLSNLSRSSAGPTPGSKVRPA
jgi:hypothetical protein